MSCPCCGARFYVLARLSKPVVYDPSRTRPAPLEHEPTIHACELHLGDIGRPLCERERWERPGMSTLAPGYLAPYGPDEARLLVTCDDCQNRIAPARPAIPTK